MQFLIQVCGCVTFSTSGTSFFNNRMGREVVGPGGIWGPGQGVGSDHWGAIV